MFGVFDPQTRSSHHFISSSTRFETVRNCTLCITTFAFIMPYMLGLPCFTMYSKYSTIIHSIMFCSLCGTATTSCNEHPTKRYTFRGINYLGGGGNHSAKGFYDFKTRAKSVLLLTVESWEFHHHGSACGPTGVQPRRTNHRLFAPLTLVFLYLTMGDQEKKKTYNVYFSIDNESPCTQVDVFELKRFRDLLDKLHWSEGTKRNDLRVYRVRNHPIYDCS